MICLISRMKGKTDWIREKYINTSDNNTFEESLNMGNQMSVRMNLELMIFVGLNIK